MANDSFYKGYSKTTGERVAAIIYAEPHPDPFSKHNDIAEVLIISDGSGRFIQDSDTLNTLYDLQREISRIEFECLQKISRLSTEIFLNQYTGRFPSVATCLRIINGLRHDFNKLIAAQESQEVNGYCNELIVQEIGRYEEETELHNRTND